MSDDESEISDTDRGGVHEHLPRLLEYVAKWAAAELVRGLMSFPKLVDALKVGASDSELCELGTASKRQFRSLLQALEVEDFVVERDGIWSFTEFGEAATGTLNGWFEIFVSGYGDYLRNASALWEGHPNPSWRDMRAVGISSVNISRHGALPLVSRLINEYNEEAQLVVDIGCADATYLVELCKAHPNLRGIGVEPADQLRQVAVELIAESGLEDRVSVIESIAALSLHNLHPDFFVFGFSLHELVEQQGREAVVEMLRALGRDHPHAHLLIVEVDYSKRDDVKAMQNDPHLRGYYNTYYMLHDFTDQVLLTRSHWRELFGDSGLTILEERAIDPEFDPTGLEIVFTLSPSGQA